MRRTHLLSGGACLFLLAGCHDPQSTAEKAPATAHPASATAPATPLADHPAKAAADFTAPALGLSVSTPRGMQLRRDFRRSYLDDGAWKTYADPDSKGTPVVALVMDGSNKIEAAELRVGTSDDPAALKHCGTVPGNAEPGTSGTTRLDGIDFIRFHAGDAAMSHFMKVESYRATHDGQCIAIDLLLTGTNPAVYPTPPKRPFTEAQAWSTLHTALGNVHFNDAED